MAFEWAALPIAVVIILGIWDLIWKGIALWKCGRNNQLVWFVVILILNTLGILPIIYLLFFQKKERTVMRVRSARKPKRKPVRRKVTKKKTTKRKKRKRK